MVAAGEPFAPTDLVLVQAELEHFLELEQAHPETMEALEEAQWSSERDASYRSLEALVGDRPIVTGGGIYHVTGNYGLDYTPWGRAAVLPDAPFTFDGPDFVARVDGRHAVKVRLMSRHAGWLLTEVTRHQVPPFLAEPYYPWALRVTYPPGARVLAVAPERDLDNLLVLLPGDEADAGNPVPAPEAEGIA